MSATIDMFALPPQSTQPARGKRRGKAQHAEDLKGHYTLCGYRIGGSVQIAERLEMVTCSRCQAVFSNQPATYVAARRLELGL